MTSTLSQIVARLDTAELHNPAGGDPVIIDVTHDSRTAVTGSLFCAVPGTVHDGHDHAAQAIAAGAVAILVERELDVPVPQIKVPSVRRAMAHAAAVVHGDPTRNVRLVGVTGTNGKTTVSYLVEAACAAAGQGVGVIGTVGARVHGQPLGSSHTTPEAPDLQRLIATMVRRGADNVVVEVSSHGLDLDRVEACEFDVAVFTNLSQDHLDWHGSMETYFQAKQRLFAANLARRAVVCVDDEWGRRLAAEAAIEVITVGERDAQVLIRSIESEGRGSRVVVALPDADVELHVALPGRFNAINAAIALATAISAGIDVAAAATGIGACAGPPGRMEHVDAGQPFAVIVDYAHTPVALTRVIEEARAMAARSSRTARVMVVAGAGGGRDRGKRDPMGAAMADADQIFLTSDNPRSEDPATIVAALAAGIDRRTDRSPVVRQTLDRREAIAAALAEARPGDVVVIAGKGHEATQEIGDAITAFDDRLVARELLEAMVADDPLVEANR